VALDLTAQTFAAALEGSSRYELRSEPVRGWLYGIAWNKLHEAQRRGRVEDKVRRALGMAPILLTDEGIERIEKLGAAPARELLEALPADQREAVRAHILDERSYTEIAPGAALLPGRGASARQQRGAGDESEDVR